MKRNSELYHLILLKRNKTKFINIINDIVINSVVINNNAISGIFINSNTSKLIIDSSTFIF